MFLSLIADEGCGMLYFIYYYKVNHFKDASTLLEYSGCTVEQRPRILRYEKRQINCIQKISEREI